MTVSLHTVSPRFLRQIGNALRYWQGKTAQINDFNLAVLEADRPNLVHVVRYAMLADELAIEAARLVVQSFQLAERRGNQAEWMALIRQLLLVVPAEHPLHVRLQDHLAMLYRLGGQADEAIRLHTTALGEAEAIGATAEAAIICFNLGYDYFDAHKYTQARAFAEEAHRRRVALSARHHAGLNNLFGLILLRTNENKAAMEEFEKAAHEFEVCGDIAYAARARLNMALCAEALGEYVEALALYDQIDAQLATIDNQLDRQQVIINRGTVWGRMGEWDKALATFLSADFPYLRRLGHKPYLAMLSTNLGFTFMHQHELGIAEEYLREAVALWRGISNSLMLANSLGTLAQVLALQKQPAEARLLLDEALTLLSNYPDDAWARKLARQFAELRDQLI